jgi:hypothetical protein
VSSYDALVNRVIAGIRQQRSAAAVRPEREKPLTTAQQRSLNALRARMRREVSGRGKGGGTKRSGWAAWRRRHTKRAKKRS